MLQDNNFKAVVFSSTFSASIFSGKGSVESGLIIHSLKHLKYTEHGCDYLKRKHPSLTSTEIY